MSTNNDTFTASEERYLVKRIEDFVKGVSALDRHREKLEDAGIELKNAKFAIIEEIKKMLPSLFATMTSTLDQEIAKRIEGHFKTLSIPTLASIERIQQKQIP
jgi:hypothetical protein